MLNIAATIAAFQGQLQEALTFLEEAQPVAQGRVATWLALNKAATLSNLRRHTEAKQALHCAQTIADSKDGYTHLMLAYAQAWQALVQNDYVGAYPACQEALHRMAPKQHPIAYYPTLATLGILAREAGDLAEAETLLMQALPPLEAREDRGAMIGIFWHLSLLARSRNDQATARAWLCKALRAMQLGGYGTTLLWQPGRFVDLCSWAVEGGIQVAHARWLLETSLAVWNIPNTTTLARLPWNALTAREQEILMLAAQGLRDREIARYLHLSIRTVQNHLQHCYDKLEVRNRTAAVRLVLERAQDE